MVFLRLSLFDMPFVGSENVGTSNFMNFMLLECVSSTIRSTFGNSLKRNFNNGTRSALKALLVTDLLEKEV